MPHRESYLIALSDRLIPLLWESPPALLTAAEKTFVCIWQLEAEVNNGGFLQYYTNSAGDFATETPGALEAIGARHTAAIVRDANALFPDGPPADRDAREAQTDALAADAFAPFDDRFLAYEEDLSALLFAFVEANRSDIRGA